MKSICEFAKKYYYSPIPSPDSLTNHGAIPLLFSVFLDYANIMLFGILMAPILLVKTNLPGSDILHFFDIGDAGKRFTLAMLIGVYPFLQFFFAPIIGQLSDRFGRKPLLLICLFCLVISSFIIALGVQLGEYYAGSIALLFIGRSFQGVCSANISVSQSSLTDYISNNQGKDAFGVKFIGFGMFASMGALTGSLGSALLPSWGGYATPFWAIDILYGFGFIWVLFFFKETLPKEKRNRNKDVSYNPFIGIKYIYQTITSISSSMAFLILMLLFYRVGWQFFVNFAQVFVQVKFNINHLEFWVGMLFVAGMLGYNINEYFINQPLNIKGVGMEKIMCFTLFLEGVFFLASSFTGSFMPGFFVLAILGITANSYNSSNSAAAIASNSPEQDKGKVMGCALSIQSIAQIIACISCAFAYNGYSGLPMILAGGIILLGWSLLILKRFFVKI